MDSLFEDPHGPGQSFSVSPSIIEKEANSSIIALDNDFLDQFWSYTPEDAMLISSVGTFGSFSDSDFPFDSDCSHQEVFDTLQDPGIGLPHYTESYETSLSDLNLSLFPEPADTKDDESILIEDINPFGVDNSLEAEAKTSDPALLFDLSEAHILALGTALTDTFFTTGGGNLPHKSQQQPESPLIQMQTTPDDILSFCDPYTLQPQPKALAEPSNEYRVANPYPEKTYTTQPLSQWSGSGSQSTFDGHDRYPYEQVHSNAAPMALQPIPESEPIDNKNAEKRKAKPIAKRFQATGVVGVCPSFVQCLNVVLDYRGFTGVIRNIILNDSITNVVYHAHDTVRQAKLMKKPLVEYYTPAPHEEFIGTVPYASDQKQRPVSVISGVLQRKIHVRDISTILDAVTLIAYVKSGRFNVHNPYEPQYYRYELDSKGKLVNESKCGMCAFCPTVKFLPFKNLSYLSHMTLEHGIFASNYVVPEGLYYGRYRMVRANDQSKTRSVKALQCPACFQVIEVACWRNKTNPLLSYFRHFKKMHLNLNKTFTSSTIDPVTLKHRGNNYLRN